jgi:hypothetical protein
MASVRKLEAVHGPVGGEDADDDAATNAGCRVHDLETAGLCCVIDEEVEHGSVVPHVISTGWLPGQQFLVEDCHLAVRGGAEALTGGLEGRLGKVEHGDLGLATRQQRISEGAGATAGVDDGAIAGRCYPLDLSQRDGRDGLIPADALGAGGGVALVPVIAQRLVHASIVAGRPCSHGGPSGGAGSTVGTPVTPAG